MATSTLIQYLETSQVDGFGAAVAVGSATMNRRQTEIFLAGEAVLIGDCVSLDLSQAADGDKAVHIVKADSGTATDRCPVGVVLRSAENDGSLAAGSRIEVVVRGVCEANVAAHAAGDVLGMTAVPGQLDTVAAATDAQVAIGIDGAGAPGLATVYVRGAF